MSKIYTLEEHNREIEQGKRQARCPEKMTLDFDFLRDRRPVQSFEDEHPITGRRTPKIWRPRDGFRKRMWDPITKSFTMGTSVEVMYTSFSTGTQLNTFTTEDNLQKTLPHAVIPANFFTGAQGTGKCLRIKACGRLGTTGTPTFTFSIRLLTSTTWSAGGGANTVLNGLGEVRSGTGFAAGGGIYTIPAANTAFTVSIDHTVSQYVFLSAACGTNNALNLIQLEMLKLYGEN